ncbi:MAG: M48 family metalloprotease [Pseudomonadota bacterium]
MKTVLTVMAFALACAGCKEVSPLLNNAMSNMSLNDMASAVGKGQQLIEGQRDMTVAEEVALGSGIASNMLGAAPLWQDRKAQRYVNQVGQWLAMQTERSDLVWHFAVLDDAEFNAFAAPGGYILITRGLLHSMRSEAELAGVLAHEIAHVVRKHHLNAIKKAADRAIWAEMGGKGASMLAQSGSMAKYKELTPALTKLASAGTEMYLRGLDKEDEFEADRMGVVIAARAGYDPYGLPAVLQTLQALNPSTAGLALMFRTHPAFSERLDRLGQVMSGPFDRFENQPALAARFKVSVTPPRGR